MNLPAISSNSARATASGESRYRISYPLAPTRGARVIALDTGAEVIVRKVAGMSWTSAHFFTAEVASRKMDFDGGPVEMNLRNLDGGIAPLKDELAEVDVVVMVATEDSGFESAATIAAACTVRGIMTAGIIEGTTAMSTVSVLRQYARMLVISADENDLEALLTAIRA